MLKPVLPDTAEIGVITKTRGLKGLVVVKPWSDGGRTFYHVKTVTAVKGEHTTQLKIEEVSSYKDRLVLKFLGVDHIDRAEELIGASLIVGLAELPPAEEGRYYEYQLVGLEVLDSSGNRLGRVLAVDDLPGNDLLVIGTPSGKKLVPLVAPIVSRVELSARTLTIDNIEGLLD